MVAEWVLDAWKKVATDDLIVRGFLHCGNIGWNGDICALHSKLHATVESREVPAKVIDEVNAFLEEMRMAEAEEVVDVDEHNDEQVDEQLQAEEELGMFVGCGASLISHCNSTKQAVDFVRMFSDTKRKML